jgi:hypothetical protein
VGNHARINPSTKHVEEGAHNLGFVHAHGLGKTTLKRQGRQSTACAFVTDFEETENRRKKWIERHADVIDCPRQLFNAFVRHASKDGINAE